MGFAWPTALLGLVALALPLLIHWLARGESRRVEVATTRYIPQHYTVRFRQIQLEHPLLFVLRTLLVTLCVLLLAEPYHHVPDNADPNTAWTLVSTQLTLDQATAQLGTQDSPARWLAPGFPSVQRPRPASRADQLWSLLDAADKQAPAGSAFNVLIPSSMGSPGGRRPTLNRSVRWIDAGSSTVEVPGTEQINVDIVYDSERYADARAIAVAIAAWQDIGINAVARLIPAGAASNLSPYVAWLSSAPFQADDTLFRRIVTDHPLTDSALTLTGFTASGASSIRVQQVGRQRVYVLDPMFDDDGSPLHSLARDLTTTFISERLSLPPADYPVAQRQLDPVRSNAASNAPQHRQFLATPLLWMIVLIAMIERLVSARTMGVAREV